MQEHPCALPMGQLSPLLRAEGTVAAGDPVVSQPLQFTA